MIDIAAIQARARRARAARVRIATRNRRARMLTRYGVACIVSVVIVAVGLYARTGSIIGAFAVAVVTAAALGAQNRSTHTWH